MHKMHSSYSTIISKYSFKLIILNHHKPPKLFNTNHLNKYRKHCYIKVNKIKSIYTKHRFICKGIQKCHLFCLSAKNMTFFSCENVLQLTHQVGIVCTHKEELLK